MSSEQPTPIVFTLTLPDPGGEGTLLIQRGDLAKLFQFHYTNTGDMASAIHDATNALIALENNPPPVIPDLPPRKTAVAAAPTPPAEPPEPMIHVPTKTKKKGTTAIPVRCLRVVSGDTDDAAQQQALKLAGRLLDSGLWDGQTPIGIDDAHATQPRLDGLTDRELKVLFRLEQFVQVNPEISATDEAQDTGNGLQTQVDTHNQDTDKTL